MATTIETNQLNYRTILDAIPLPIMLVDDDMTIIDLNRAGQEFLHRTKTSVIRKRGGEALNCVHSADAVGGCGRGPFCGTCVIRNSVQEAAKGKHVMKQSIKVELAMGKTIKDTSLMISTSPIRLYGRDLVLLILEDVSELSQLRSLIPMCANCKRVRDDADYWHHVEIYFRDFLGMDVSHGICQECVKELYPEHSDRILKNVRGRGSSI
jgi:PAS domain-containing protein